MSQVRPIENLFAELVELKTVVERAAYLDEVCGEDSDLRNRLEKLLAAHEQAGSFLQDDHSVEATAEMEFDSSLVGSKIGPYKLREVMGEGGMGTVYVAEQEKPLRRKVAIKVIKAGMDSKAVIARFEAERNALAMMNHSHIAKVLDAGTTEQGRPFFAMELVSGIPITDYCDEHKLTIDERLELFVQVCQAIQHAHQKGIIHRDIKPSNVLVTELDGKPVPKVIDFGVAKALNQSLTDHSIYTSFQSVIGTPLYMSPEQANLSAVDVDTRSDVYSLGVLLYELLTGTTPFEQSKLKEAAQHEVLRIIREEEPPRPSNRISTLGKTASRISQRRQTQPDRLGRLVKGDLDWIVMTALAKERSRRYESASRLAEDVQRHLDNEVVEARPPSRVYRLRKIYSRNRAATWGGLLIGSALLFGTVALLIGLLQANKAIEERQELLYQHFLFFAMNDDIERCYEILEVVAAEKFDPQREALMQALTIFFDDRKSEATVDELLLPFLEQRDANPETAALLALDLAWKGDMNGYYKAMRYLDDLPLRDASDATRLLLAMAESMRNEDRALEICERVVHSHPNWVNARVMQCIYQNDQAIQRMDEGLAEQSEQLGAALQEVSGADSMATPQPFISAYYGTLIAAEKPDGDVEDWTQRAKAAAARLSSSPNKLEFGQASFYEAIGELDEARSKWDQWRDGRNQQSSSGGHLHDLEYVAFLLRRGAANDAQKHVDRFGPEAGLWIDLCRLVLIALQNDYSTSKEAIQIIEKWRALGDDLYPPFRLHLVDMAMLFGEEQLAREIARELHDFDWPSPTHKFLGETMKLIADGHDEEILALVARAEVGGQLTTMQRGELYYHLGIYWLACGERERAIEYFEKAPKFGPFWLGCDYYFARPFATRLQEDKDWPTWVE